MKPRSFDYNKNFITYTTDKFEHLEGALRIMINVVRSEISDRSTNPEQSCLYFPEPSQTLQKNMNSTILHPPMVK